MAQSSKRRDDYEQEINTLKREMKRLRKQARTAEKSKISFMLNATTELDRLRGYIKHLNPRRKNGFAFECDATTPMSKKYSSSDIDGLLAYSQSSDDDHDPDDGAYHTNEHELHNSERVEQQPQQQAHSESNTAPPQLDSYGQQAPQPHEESVVVRADDIQQAIDIHHDVIVEMEADLNKFTSLQLFGVVECKCAEPQQLQFIVRMDADPHLHMSQQRRAMLQCDNCQEHYTSMFMCDVCCMSICTQCQTYIAEMQCLRAVMQQFTYAKDFQIKDAQQQRKYHDNHSTSLFYSDYDAMAYHDDSLFGGGGGAYPAQALEAYLIEIVHNLHSRAQIKLNDILEQYLSHVTSEKMNTDLSFDILAFLDDADLSCMIPTKWSVQLLEIYWQLYQYHLVYDEHAQKWIKRRLLFSKQWESEQVILIKDRIAKNNVYKGYIKDYYIPTKNKHQLIKPRLFDDDDDEVGDDADDDEHKQAAEEGDDGGGYIRNHARSQYDNAYVNQSLNDGFQTKVLRLLRIIIDKEERTLHSVTFERLKHKKYGKRNEIIANGIFYIWHCHELQRSFALEEQLFSSALYAQAEEHVHGPEPQQQNPKYSHFLGVSGNFGAGDSAQQNEYDYKHTYDVHSELDASFSMDQSGTQPYPTPQQQFEEEYEQYDDNYAMYPYHETNGRNRQTSSYRY